MPGPTGTVGYPALLVSFAVSSFGSGMVLPLTAVYISSQLGLGAQAAGRYFVLIAVTSFLGTLVGGRLADRRRPGAVAAAGLVVLAAGYALLALAGSALSVMLCAVVVGAGNSLLFPALPPALGAVVPESQRRRAFSQRYTAMNVGIGLGAAAGSAIVGRLHGDTGYHLLYLADAATFLPLAVTLLRVGPVGRDAEPAGQPDEPPQEQERRTGSGYLTLLRSRPILLLALVQCFSLLFGYAQFETAAPLLIHRALAGEVWLLGAVVAVNTAVVVLLQAPLRRWFSRRTESSALVVGALFWAGAYGCGALAAGLRSPVGPSVMVAFAVLFAVGETAYACSFYPLMMRLAPDGLLGRVSALTSLGSNVGSTVGPALGVAVAASLDVRVGWVLLAGGALVLAGTGVLLHRTVGSTTVVAKEEHV
ncbi:MFS transporter [Kitasatospora sp. NPDC056138]|uniref:MFS transporter n=1 Tax=Kitasatospora sp. NPDC056138 TaxID=3345724 RepID=UPI0035DAAFB1